MITEAEKKSEVAAIEYEQKIKEKETMKKMSSIEGTYVHKGSHDLWYYYYGFLIDQAHKAKIIAKADADFYAIQKEAEANKVIYIVTEREATFGLLGYRPLYNQLQHLAIVCRRNLLYIFQTDSPQNVPVLNRWPTKL